MKKLICLLLVLAMMISLIIVATIPTAAIDGDWVVVAQADQEFGEIPEDEYKSVAGYEYCMEGFRLISANWAGQTPWARFVSRNKVDLKEGVYMEIRIDEFNYDAGLDSWFNVMLWDQQVMTPGNTHYGEGVQNLIRPGIGNVTHWFTEQFTQLPPNKNWSDVPQDIDEDGKHHLTVVISWDEDNSTFVYTINGVSAAEGAIAYMNEKWGGNDSEAYVGFCFQHNGKGEDISCTLTKFGTSADDAVTPAGDDYADPIDYSLNYVNAPIVEGSQVEAGQPAILMNGNLDSHIKNYPRSATGEIISINDDDTVEITAFNSYSATGNWIVENATSYAIEDFPIMTVVTRNLCTCTEEDKYDGLCGAFECAYAYIMVGDKLVPDASCMLSAWASWDSYYIGEDSYIEFAVDVSEIPSFTGRINAVRFDVSQIDMFRPGASTFDICYVAFFATYDDANAYFMNYINDLGYDDREEESTEIPDEVTTTTSETTVIEETTDVVETTVMETTEIFDTTETPDTTFVDTTDAPETTEIAESTGIETAEMSETTDTPEHTSAEDDSKIDSDNDDLNDIEDEILNSLLGGCGSVVGFGTVAIVTVVAVAGFVSFKKKKD